MLKDITLGQYYPVKSFVHDLDPRVKIILTVAFIVLVLMILLVTVTFNRAVSVTSF